MKVDEFFHELKYLSTRRGDPKRDWTFVERIQDNEYWTPFRQCQHLFEAFLQSVVAWLSSTFVVGLINAVEDSTARSGSSSKLEYK